MRPDAFPAVIGLCLALAAGPLSAQGFKFSQQDDAANAEEAARQNRIMTDLGTPCRADILGKKIMVMIGEVRSDGWTSAQQENYGPHYQAINNRLRSLGLQTYTPEEIRKQIAQAEIDAYFKNKPDAALSAARRLGASFVLRGLISSQAVFNPIVQVNQVSVDMGFTLSSASGRLVSETQASSASYAGVDVSRMALTLVNEQADEVVARLYADYCRNAGLAAGGKTAPK